MFFTKIALLSSLLLGAQAAPTPEVDDETCLVERASGQATFYGGNTQGGECSFNTYTIPSGVFGTALSGANWAGAANCGACMSVTGPNGKKVTVMVTDRCPECKQDGLDLYENAFVKLADKSAGIIPISWDYVACPISSPLQLRNKEGVSPYWFSMQVVNAKDPVAKMEVSANGGKTWMQTERQNYNFFQIASGTGTDTVTVKVTSSKGKAVTVSNVKIQPLATTNAKSNF